MELQIYRCNHSFSLVEAGEESRNVMCYEFCTFDRFGSAGKSIHGLEFNYLVLSSTTGSGFFSILVGNGISRLESSKYFSALSSLKGGLAGK